MSRTLQFRRLGTGTLANTVGANGELIINSTARTLTIHDGVTPGGFALLNQLTTLDVDQFARNTANAANNLAQSAYDFANTISISNIDEVARNTANTASNNINILQGVDATQNLNITLATNLAQEAYNNSNTKFSLSGGQITGNVIIVGNLDVTNNTIVSNAMEANNVIVDGTLLTGLAARTSVVLPHLIAQFASNSASYVQTNSQNINPEGSADWVVTADNGTDTDYYIDLGLHGSQAYDGILTPYDGYLYVQGSTIGQAGGNLIIGTTSSFPGLETMFVSGGYQFQNNIVMRVGSYGANVIGDMIITERAMLTKITEKFSDVNDATGVVVHDCSTGHIFNHSSIDNNFTANFTNLNLDSGQATTITLVLNQGATAYIANSVQIGGIAQTIRWSANTVPTGNTNAVDVQSFSILNSSGTYTVLGQLSTFG